MKSGSHILWENGSNLNFMVAFIEKDSSFVWNKGPYTLFNWECYAVLQGGKFSQDEMVVERCKAW